MDGQEKKMGRKEDEKYFQGRREMMEYLIKHPSPSRNMWRKWESKKERKNTEYIHLWSSSLLCDRSFFGDKMEGENRGEKLSKGQKRWWRLMMKRKREKGRIEEGKRWRGRREFRGEKRSEHQGSRINKLEHTFTSFFLLLRLSTFFFPLILIHKRTYQGTFFPLRFLFLPPLLLFSLFFLSLPLIKWRRREWRGDRGVIKWNDETRKEKGAKECEENGKPRGRK